MIRALVKRVDVAHHQVNVVFRIDPHPGDLSPENKRLQHCRGSNHGPLWHSDRRLRPLALLGHSGPRPFLDQAEDARIGHAMLEELDEPFVGQRVEGFDNSIPPSMIHAMTP
jgi:hypothetical protein